MPKNCYINILDHHPNYKLYYDAYNETYCIHVYKSTSVYP